MFAAGPLAVRPAPRARSRNSGANKKRSLVAAMLNFFKEETAICSQILMFLFFACSGFL